MPEAAERACAVDVGGFEELGGDILEGGQEIDHVEAGVDPHGGEDEDGAEHFFEPFVIGVEGMLAEGEEGGDVVEGDTDQAGLGGEHEGDEKGDENEAHEEGGEEDKAVDGFAEEVFLIEEEGESEGARHLRDERAGGEVERVGHGLKKDAVLGETVVVVEANAAREAGAGAELGGEPEGLQQRVEDKGAEDQQEGHDEEIGGPGGVAGFGHGLVSRSSSGRGRGRHFLRGSRKRSSSTICWSSRLASSRSFLGEGLEAVERGDVVFLGVILHLEDDLLELLFGVGMEGGRGAEWDLRGEVEVEAALRLIGEILHGFVVELIDGRVPHFLDR